MAEKACHSFGSTTQVGLTQALAPMERRVPVLLAVLACGGCGAEQSGSVVTPQPDGTALEFPSTDREFAAVALSVARPGRKLEEVVRELESRGFFCQRKGEEDAVCGPRVPALHNCQRNITLSTYGQGIARVKLEFFSPFGFNSDGQVCGR